MFGEGGGAYGVFVAWGEEGGRSEGKLGFLGGGGEVTTVSHRRLFILKQPWAVFRMTYLDCMGCRNGLRHRVIECSLFSEYAAYFFRGLP